MEAAVLPLGVLERLQVLDPADSLLHVPEGTVDLAWPLVIRHGSPSQRIGW